MQHFDVVAVCIDHSAANDDAPPVPVEAVVDPTTGMLPTTKCLDHFGWNSKKDKGFILGKI